MKNKMEVYLLRIREQVDWCEQIIKNAPEGKLICNHDGQYTKWYLRKNDKTVYLPKGERSLAEKLARKRLAQLWLKYLKKEEYAVNQYLRHGSDLPGCCAEFLDEDSAYSDLLSEQDTRMLPLEVRKAPKDIQLGAARWASEEYERKQDYEDSLKIRTISGHVVRSKSEAMIDMNLYQAGLAFRYESVSVIGNKTIHPDFSIMHPRTGQIILWEHFGMMDYPEYVQNYHTKMKLYIDNGYIPGDNLIVTYETLKHPLDSITVTQTIQMFFS